MPAADAALLPDIEVLPVRDLGELDEILLCDQTYNVAEMSDLLRDCGFAPAVSPPSTSTLPLYDAPDWVVYVARN